MHVNNEQLKKFIADTGLVSLADVEAAEKKSQKNEGGSDMGEGNNFR